MLTNIPFYPNAKCGKRCASACIRMIHVPLLGEEISQSEADEISGFVEGKPTWPFKMMHYFAAHGVEVLNIENMDAEAYATDMCAAMKSQFPEIADQIIKRSDIPREQNFVRQLVTAKNVIFEKRIPKLEDIFKLIDDGYIVTAAVNYYPLMGDDENYNGHFIVLLGRDEKTGMVHLHNSGLPPIENQAVTMETLHKAMYLPDAGAANLIAFKNQL